jgi:hypothetical protein
MTTELNQIYKLIKQWEDTYLDYGLSESQLAENRADLVAQMHALGASHPECAPWSKALNVAIAEQGKYEVWRVEAFNPPYWVYEGSAKRRATIEEKAAHTTAMIAKRDAIRQDCEDKGQPAPEWTFPDFNPRVGPAACIHVNGEYPPS